MALELYDIMQRYNSAKNLEDDMMKDIELQKIQAEFITNNETLEVQDRRIKELEEDVSNLKVERERLKDINAQLRLQIGGHTEPDKKEVEEIIEETEDNLRTLQEIALDF